MAASDDDMIAMLRRSDRDYRLLEQRHQELSRQLDQLIRHHVLTPQEEVLKKQLQKQKLAAKDEMNAMLRHYREQSRGQGKAARPIATPPSLTGGG